ncbi:hypothetical protein ALQ31_00656 [Pseudomonas amygdali pv. morsprunorum]|nr:hypothetical protein ALQ31_00656 [Pseudomonas amygdali pv. morsprunorum]
MWDGHHATQGVHMSNSKINEIYEAFTEDDANRYL